jgi:hypothetical protein
VPWLAASHSDCCKLSAREADIAVKGSFLGKFRDQEIEYHPDSPAHFQFAMSYEPNVDQKRVKTRQYALYHWLGVSDVLCHKPNAQPMLDKLPSDEMVLRYDREVSQCQCKSTLIERFDKQVSSVNTEKICVTEIFWQCWIANLAKVARCSVCIFWPIPITDSVLNRSSILEHSDH